MLDVPRALLTALYRAAVEGAAPFPRTHRAARDWLVTHRDDFEPGARVHLIALGKAAPSMFAGTAQALADLELPVAGGVIVRAFDPSEKAASGIPDTVRVVTGDHPVPGPGSLEAGDAIEAAVHEVHAGDVVMILLSGGTTALAAAPV
ncbi:MAG: DUF4147 domain-containing protein, partial [Gemmatimonas sp.]